MARVHSLVCEALLDDEDSQVAGYVYINDESGMNMGFVSLWSLTDLRSIVKCIQNSTPMRHKETHFVNIPHYANRIIELGVSMLSDKLKKRIIVSSFRLSSNFACADCMAFFSPSGAQEC